MSNLGESNLIVFTVLIPLGAALLGFWIWMMVDVWRNKTFTRRDRRFWTIVLVALRPVGALLYYFKQFRPRRRLTDASSHKAS